MIFNDSVKKNSYSSGAESRKLFGNITKTFVILNLDIRYSVKENLWNLEYCFLLSFR